MEFGHIQPMIRVVITIVGQTFGVRTVLGKTERDTSHTTVGQASTELGGYGRCVTDIRGLRHL